MSGRFAIALVVSFAAGVLLTAGIGGGLGAFDRGPTLVDVAEARATGAELGRAEVDAQMAGSLEEERTVGFRKGQESTEASYWDQIGYPDLWIDGLDAGRARLLELAEEAYASGYVDGERQGQAEATGADP